MRQSLLQRFHWVGLGLGNRIGVLGTIALPSFLLMTPAAIADPKAPFKPLRSSSVGATGVNALILHQAPYNLLGRKIAIGQVEIGRPGQFGFDKAVAQNRSMSLTRVFYRNGQARTNANVDSHAQNVASIMISTAKASRGVAPEARLYSSAAGTPRRYGQPEECLTAQYVAQQNSGDLRAINFSFGESLRHDPRAKPVLDGNALLTQCVDWSARIHNVLYVVAGNQGKGGISIPTDNFNGVNVAFTSRVQEQFAKVDYANLGDPANGAAVGVESNVGPRRAIALVAPGNEVSLVNPNGSVISSSGTSFAAPHVTGIVALLQEYSDRKLRETCNRTTGCAPPWTVDARQAEVMKAVLLNSADKIKDAGNGLNLNMSRTIVDKNNRSWLNSDAYRNPKIPLHTQMGTGQVNALRAFQQFSPGQSSPDGFIPAIGWSYHQIGNAEPAVKSNPIAPTSPQAVYQDYVLEKPLKAGSFVSVTLTWNRLVELIDKNQNGDYDVGEDFRDRGLNNLDVYLMKAEETDLKKAVWSSVSEVDSVEHIFHKILAAGRYKIRVVFKKQVNSSTQPYALAWWTAANR
jgi:Subtilase family